MTHQNSYDEVPYPSLSYTQSHPNRMATIAALLGMTPTPVSGCRVLELGCAGGGNLIPMAYYLPESKFVGLDLSAHQIAEAQQTAASLGLTNTTFNCMNIMEVDAELGQFDYIIAHGVYSWVPPQVQAKILQICQQNLSPQGVAYISYNTYPGWHMFGFMREMMLFHTRRIDQPQAKATQARSLLDFLADAVPPETGLHGGLFSMYKQFLNGEGQNSGPKDDAFFLHDELEEVNDPVYFYQFVEQAEQHGLQYLAEAEFASMFPNDFSPDVAQTLRQMSGSVTDMEQYIDFLRNRTFRQTLLCHQDIALQRKLTLDPVTQFHIASRARPAADNPDIYSISAEQFCDSRGAKLTTNHPVSKIALQKLRQSWPQATPFETLLAAGRDEFMAHQPDNAPLEKPATDAKFLAANLLRAYSYSGQLMEFHAHRLPAFTTQISERPVVSPVARFQAQHSNVVTNLRHERVSLDEFDRFLLQTMDGRHNQAALVDAVMAGPVAAGQLVMKQDGQAVAPGNQGYDALSTQVHQRLRWLARTALLIN